MKLLSMDCEYRVRINWKDISPYILIGLCKLQGCEPVYCPKFKQECPIYLREYNIDTSALPSNGEDIVRTACITNEDAEVLDKELIR